MALSQDDSTRTGFPSRPEIDTGRCMSLGFLSELQDSRRQSGFPYSRSLPTNAGTRHYACISSREAGGGVVEGRRNLICSRNWDKSELDLIIMHKLLRGRRVAFGREGGGEGGQTLQSQNGARTLMTINIKRSRTGFIKSSPRSRRRRPGERVEHYTRGFTCLARNARADLTRSTRLLLSDPDKH